MNTGEQRELHKCRQGEASLNTTYYHTDSQFFEIYLSIVYPSQYHFIKDLGLLFNYVHLPLRETVSNITISAQK